MTDNNNEQKTTAKQIALQIKQIENLNFSSEDLKYHEFAEIKKNKLDKDEITTFKDQVQADYETLENDIYYIRNAFSEEQNLKETAKEEARIAKTEVNERINQLKELSESTQKLVGQNELIVASHAKLEQEKMILEEQNKALIKQLADSENTNNEILDTTDELLVELNENKVMIENQRKTIIKLQNDLAKTKELNNRAKKIIQSLNSVNK
ncbi:hypothetical protein [Pseudolactococcus insecticola]|uniref:Uncharacterized protein n=1 Tax=Pseudolactococcus insecticola TaxID=2709158 RepID=A0A6A0B9W1_9LACT|nr:hypothetical protein [Lactococcus insecticola]GFH41241.1 hypothetical protein Hs20B_16390 [Lactococcus insecticola]